MKKLFVWILLLFVILKIGGLGALLSMQRELAKREIRSYINQDKQLEKITLIEGNLQNLAKIEWEEDEKEFWYNGKLYDIVEIKTINKTKYYYCISDENEEQIIAQIKKLIDDNHERNPLRSTSKLIISFLLLPAILSYFEFPNRIIFVEIILSKFPTLNCTYSYLFAAKLFSPPKFSIQ
ncbi:hypothetical protein Emtol_3997 [Emticicia oligotrophica DSM 17448]|uniref:Uncharacterized protein n=1 Tax=Emticicia oligotrophica (strain DSM 17448 / CIP 109782 / MTCC 6937 / GPTSA100-15) TaxID=929562 RepID=A0ABM5N6P0_EMTOG|nr:hypothetical protein [Emticicia oligotrophica]AFK05122.1 hypothetical protein Emtol_3997 [Emticicia oligotrophica DSM 17448]